jgi:class 3 adenylate cyclase
VKLMGDGSMGVFSGPAAAIRAAQLIRDDARMDDLSVRAGIHTGECERMAGGDLSGLAVHIAARVGAAAGPGEVWVSRTVRDLIGGSGLQLKSMGTHQLKGVAEEWELFSVVGQDETAAAIAEEPSAMRAGDRLILATARRAPRLLRGLNRIETSRRRRASANR